MKPMNLLLAAAVCCSAMALAACGKSDQASIQGTWNVTSMEMGGQKLPMAGSKKATMVITADTITATDEHGDSGKYTLNSGTSPKQLDLSPTEGAGKGKTMKCIYELNGDTLKMGFPEDPDKRPAGFDAKDVAVMELARQK